MGQSPCEAGRRARAWAHRRAAGGQGLELGERGDGAFVGTDDDGKEAGLGCGTRLGRGAVAVAPELVGAAQAVGLGGADALRQRGGRGDGEGRRRRQRGEGEPVGVLELFQVRKGHQHEPRQQPRLGERPPGGDVGPDLQQPSVSRFFDKKRVSWTPGGWGRSLRGRTSLAVVASSSFLSSF